MRAYWDKPDVPQRPHLELVRCAEREPTADNERRSTTASSVSSLPNDHGPATRTDPEVASRSADRIHGLDIVDLAYLHELILPRLKRAVADLEQATDESDRVEAITACRRILACSLTAKKRADSLERRLP